MSYRIALLIVTALNWNSATASEVAGPTGCLKSASIEQRIATCSSAIAVLEKLGVPLERVVGIVYETRGTALFEAGDRAHARMDFDKAIALHQG
jgi:hypothetical protein